MDTNIPVESDGHLFHHFPRLPKEVQLRIWQLAIWPRNVTVACLRNPRNRLDVRFYDPESAPAVMHTCQDSRREAAYTRAFSIGPYPHYIWVNYDYDTFQISDRNLKVIGAKELESIRKVIIDIMFTDGFHEIYIDEIYKMRSVEDIVMLDHQSFRCWGNSLGWISETFEAIYGQSPTLKAIEKPTGKEMNMQNFRELACAERGRYARRGIKRRHEQSEHERRSGGSRGGRTGFIPSIFSSVQSAPWNSAIATPPASSQNHSPRPPSANGDLGRGASSS